MAGLRSLPALLAALEKTYPRAECALVYSNPFELLVATILSAQCTDTQVNRITKGLFQKYRRPGDYLGVQRQELEQDIRSTGFYRNKARSIQETCRILVDKFGEQVPDRMEDLVTLPGVGRKTANVVLGTGFGKEEGVVVDTHVLRLAYRLGLTRQKNQPDKIEKDLMQCIPRREWTLFSHRLIQHGRQVCRARRPLCGECALQAYCEKNGVSFPASGGSNIRRRRNPP